jgi:hypothetical protein
LLSTGPDGFGYTVDPSPFVNRDIASLPNVTVITAADDLSVPFDLGAHTFNFYGHTYTGNNQLFVSSNGLITFGSANSEFFNTNLSGGDPSQAAISGLWDDYVKDSGDAGGPMVVAKYVRFQGSPLLVFEWSNVYHFGFPNTERITFQVGLQVDTGNTPGDWGVNYLNLNAGGDANWAQGASATVGSKDVGNTSSNVLLQSFNNGSNPLVHTGQAIRFHYGNLLHNGGFETGDFTGWTQVGDTSFTSVNSSNPNNGTYEAQFGPTGSLGGITQTVATTAGQAYRLSFFLSHPYTDSGTGAEFQVQIGGATVDDQMSPPNFGYTQFTYHYTATGASTAITIQFHEPPNYFFLDDVAFALAPNLLANGGFESGNLQGWTQVGDTSFSGVDNANNIPVHSGTYAGFFGPSSSLGGITQTVATAVGQQYQLQLFLSHPFSDSGTEFRVQIGGVTVDDRLNPGNFGYTLFSYGYSATGTSTAITIQFLEPPNFFYLDDVSFSPVPNNRVVNGGFETGDFTGWTQVGDTSFSGVSSGVPVHSGTFAGFFGPASSLGGITQTVATAAGQPYQLHLWLSHPYTDTGTEYRVDIGAVTVDDQVNPGNFGYTEFTYNYTATGASTAITIRFLEPPNFFYLDDVSFSAAADISSPSLVTAPAPTTETASKSVAPAAAPAVVSAPVAPPTTSPVAKDVATAPVAVQPPAAALVGDNVAIVAAGLMDPLAPLTRKDSWVL